MYFGKVHGLRSTSPPPGPIQVYMHHTVSEDKCDNINIGTMYKCTGCAAVETVGMEEVVGLREDE